MNFVFFDIECACVHKTYAKICAFGYVVCDENFNIIEKEDLLINPKGRFELTDRKGDKGIVLPYDYGEFKKYPVFPAVYPRIKSLLEDKNNIVLGHAVLNDVKYLNLETRRFKLPSFNFSFYDSQLIFMTYKNDYSHQFGLEHIANDLNVEFTPHRAADDAYATMRIVQAMCRAADCNFGELVKNLKITSGRICNRSVVRPQSGGFRQYNAEKAKFKEERARARTRFYNNVTRKRPKKSGKLLGLVFTFSKLIEDDIKQSIPLVNAIYERGGTYTGRLAECDIYVCADGDGTVRTKTANESGEIKVITPEGLKELLGND